MRLCRPLFRQASAFPLPSRKTTLARRHAVLRILTYAVVFFAKKIRLRKQNYVFILKRKYHI